MYGGLSRPTALDSDSPFAIANHALNDKSTPTAPTLKIPTRRAPPAAPSPQSPAPGHPHPRPVQGNNTVQGDWRNPHGHPIGPGSGPAPAPASASAPMQSPGGGSGGGGYGLREGARDAYMGAGAYDARTGRYGPANNATPAFPPQHQQQHQYPHQQQQQQQPHQQQQHQAQIAAHQAYGSSQTSSRQPGYSQPYPQQVYQQQQRPTTAQSSHQQGSSQPTGPYPLVERNARSPAPSTSTASPSAYPYSSSPANPTTLPQHSQHNAYPNVSPYAPSPAQLSATASAAGSPGFYQQATSPASTAGMGVGMGPGGAVPTVVNPNQLSTRPSGQGPRRSDSKDSATGQELWEMFSSMDLRRTGQLGNKEVMELLSRDSRWRITPREDCVKMLMSIFDSDRSGFISFSEFEGLWAYIKDWHKIFLRFDRDNSGTIDRSELDQALQSFGYPLPRDLVRKLEKRFAPPKDSGGSVPRGITFDRFLMACVTVKHFTEAFRRRDARNEGKLTIDYNTFMDLVIDAPV